MRVSGDAERIKKKDALYFDRMDKIKIAKQLFYPKSVIQALKEAKTLGELDIIMNTARHNL